LFELLAELPRNSEPTVYYITVGIFKPWQILHSSSDYKIQSRIFLVEVSFALSTTLLLPTDYTDEDSNPRYFWKTQTWMAKMSKPNPRFCRYISEEHQNMAKIKRTHLNECSTFSFIYFKEL
jgi:hypothetical protein